MSEERTYKKWTARDVKKSIAVPTDLDNKYSRGVLGIITGSAQYPGAAVLSTAAASATGLGLIRFHSSSGLAHLVLHSCPEVVVQPGQVSAWLLGSGISDQKYKMLTTWLRHRWFALAKRQSMPTVLDAGALYLAGQLTQPTLITPHAGELSKLLKSRGLQVSAEAIEGDPRKWVQIASDTLKVTVLLKGAITFVADSDQLIELPKATAWLATAGTGDVLAGIVAALVATNEIEILNDESALARIAASAAFIHNTAALKASDGGPLTSTQILDYISQSIKEFI
jgi:ADP-dependent NAD(P)H-hydrate dehydratase / NAD(P)H-hydrate epimerase